MIGSSLRKELEEGGHSVVRLGRSALSAPDCFSWDPVAGQGPPLEALDGVDAVINLAGANLNARRWTRAFKEELWESRLRSTGLLAEAIAGMNEPPSVFVSGSAVGYYGSRGDEELFEQSSAGSGFLAELCREWEMATTSASEAGIRVVLPRIGPVLSTAGGVLETMIPAFKLGTGGWLGDGSQWLSWITLRDVVRAFRFVVEGEAVSGAINLVAPNPVTNRQFAKALGRAMHRPAVMSVPKFAAQLVFGEVIEEVGLASARVTPRLLLEAGFEFLDTEIAAALEAVL